MWLNTPRKPLEASGTSGMKAAMNGTLHLSIGDGWWAEGFTGDNGWLIEGRTESTEVDHVDAADADALYSLLEAEVVPAFYERDTRGTSAPLDSSREARHPHGDAGVFGAPHAQGIRGTRLRAGVPETLTRYNRRNHGEENR